MEKNMVYELDCPHCKGAFSIIESMCEQLVECPHCDGDIQLGTAEDMGITKVKQPAQEEAAYHPPVESTESQQKKKTKSTKKKTKMRFSPRK